MGDAVSAVLQPAFQPGRHYDLAAEDYHAVDALSSSGIKVLLRSPAHFVTNRAQPSEPTPSMQFGSAVHMGVLEPEQFERRVIEAPKFDRRTTAGKAGYVEWQAQTVGKLSFDPETFEHINRCIDAIRSHDGAMRLIDGVGMAELSLMWTDAQYEVPCKARLDYLRPDLGVVDLKTAEDASPDAFGRAVATYSYHVQQAWYQIGCEHALDASPRFFAFVAAEKSPPYGVACYTLPIEAVLAGINACNLALSRYADCLRRDRWPSYPTTIEPVPVPRWLTQS